MSEVPEGIIVFHSGFIDEIKGKGEMMRKKSRLFGQNYGDRELRESPLSRLLCKCFRKGVLFALVHLYLVPQ